MYAIPLSKNNFKLFLIILCKWSRERERERIFQFVLREKKRESPWPCTQIHSHSHLCFYLVCFFSGFSLSFILPFSLSLQKLSITHTGLFVSASVRFFFQVPIFPVIQSVWKVSSNDEDIPLVDFVPNFFNFFSLCFYFNSYFVINCEWLILKIKKKIFAKIKN